MTKNTMAPREEYEKLVRHLIKDHQNSIGDTAWQIAANVDGVQVAGGNSVTLESEDMQAVRRLAEEFQTLFGTDVQESLQNAAHNLDHPIEIPPFLEADRELQGYIEYKRDTNWEVADEFNAVAHQPSVWARLFGFGTKEVPASEFDVTPVAERRGIPLDASNLVHEAWAEQKQAENGFKRATGHTWVTAEEIPEQLLSDAADELVDPLMAATDQFGPDRTRLIGWLTHSF